MGKVRAYLVGMAVLFAVLVTFVNLDTTFNISAQTERVKLITGNGSQIHWYLENVYIIQNYEFAQSDFVGYIQWEDSVEVLIERIGNGPLKIHAEAIGKRESCGVFYSLSEEPIGKVGKTIEIEFNDPKLLADLGRSIVLPILGKINVGRSVFFDTGGSSAILRSGEIKMLGRSLIGYDVFEAGNAPLQIGEEVSTPNQSSPAYGFIVVNEESSLRVSYRVVGKETFIIRPGGHSYAISTSVLNRLKNDSLVQGVWLSFFALIGLLKYLPSKKKLKSK